MRTIGKRKIEYFDFKLEGEEKIYRIPLAANMPYSTLKAMNDAEEDNRFDIQIDMLREYMGDVVDELTAGELSDILKAWSAACQAEGASVGES